MKWISYGSHCIRYDKELAGFIRSKRKYSFVSEMEKNVNVAELIRAITDEYGIKMLLACYETPRSAQELSDRWQIPIAACYRRIHMMESLGMLKCVSEVVGRRGRIVRMYRSALRELEFRFKDGKAMVKFVMEGKVSGISELNGKWVEIR